MYIIVLCLTAVVQFYITYMVALFLVFRVGLMLLEIKDSIKHTISLFCRSSLIALMLSAAVWLPALKQYMTSGRGEDIISGIYSCNFETSLMTVLPLLFCTSLLLIVLVDATVNYKKLRNDSRLKLWMFVLTLIPFFIEPVNKMWHTGNYMSFPARYGFITVFIGLATAADLIEMHESNAAGIQRRKPAKIVAFGVSLFAVTGFFAFSIKYYWKNRIDLDNYVCTLWGNKDSFYGLLKIFAVAVCVIALIWVLHVLKFCGKKIFCFLLAVFTVAECIFSVNVYMVSASYVNTKYDDYNKLYSLINQDDSDDFYRVGTTEKICNVNDVGGLGYNTLGHYTSLNSWDYMSAMKKLGYSAYWMEVGQYGGTTMTDRLFSVKYRLGTDFSTPYIKRTGKYYLAKTDGFLPLGILTGELSENIEHEERCDIQQEIFEKVFGRNESLICKYRPTGGCAIYKNNGRYTAAVNTGTIEYLINVYGEQELYFDYFDQISNNVKEKINGTFDISVNGMTITKKYPSQRENGLLKLGTFNNETVNIVISLNKKLDAASFGIFGLNKQILDSATESVKTADISYKNGKYTGTVYSDGSAGERELLLMLPYDEGYTIKINGQKAAYKKVLDDFISVPVEGQCSIEITYMPPLFSVGVIISVLGLAAVIIVEILRNKGKKMPENIDKIIYYIFVGAVSVVFLVVYIVPVIINLISYI